MSHTMSNRWSIVSIVAVVAFFAGVGAPQDLRAQSERPKQSSVSFAQYQANMDESYRQFDQMLASVDKAKFELEPALNDLDFDAETIIDFVSREILFQQYPGVLRGARGTLMYGAGNALDQSLLLATLLRDAGYEARIAEGHLTNEQTSELMAVIASPQHSAFSSAEVEALTESARNLNASQQNEALFKSFVNGLIDRRPRKDLEPLAQLSEENFRIIKSILSAETKFEPRPIPDQILEEAKQYFWVEFKEGASDGWRPIHPVFTEVPDIFSAVSATGYFSDSIPEEYQQRATISVEIEQAIGEKRNTHVVMPPWSRPTASLYGLELTFSNVPMNFTGSESPISQQETLEAAEFFMPVLNGAPAQSMQVFDLNGNVAPQDAVLNPASGVFRQVGVSMSKAAAALNAATSSDGSTLADFVPKLVAQTVTIELHAPGKPPRIFTKSLIAEELATFDEAGEPTMALKDALSAQLTIGLAMGDLPDQFILSETLKRLKNSRPLLDAVHAQILGTDEDALWDKSRFAGVPTNWGRMNTLVSLMHQGSLPADRVAYFAEPGLIVHKFERNRLRDLEGSLDIMSNERRVFDSSGPVPMVDPEAQLSLGAWDTAIEEAFYPRNHEVVAGTERSNSHELYTQLKAHSQLGSADALRLVGGRRWMQRDLDAGFTLLARKGTSGSAPGSVAWWRINKDTGETLGILPDGTGGASAVYPISVQIPEWLAKLIVSLVVSGAFAYGGYVDCVNATQEEECCAGVAIVGTIAGGIIGFGVGMTVLYEFSVFQLFFVEVGINGGVALYTGMDMFAEYCTTTIFGRNGGARGLHSSPEELLALNGVTCDVR